MDFFEAQEQKCANIFLFQVEEGGKKSVIGAFSSHGWKKQHHGGDNSCFLFNLSDNLKFTAISRAYIVEEGEEETFTQISEDANYNQDLDESFQLKSKVFQIHFGSKELVIKSDFRTLTSDLTNSYYFALYGDLTLRDRVSSILPGSQVIRPSAVEVWMLKGPANIFGFNRNSSHGGSTSSLGDEMGGRWKRKTDSN